MLWQELIIESLNMLLQELRIELVTVLIIYMNHSFQYDILFSDIMVIVITLLSVVFHLQD